jgi:ADP-heptose:LPS heptosyltransferase
VTEENILVIKHGALGDIVIATAGFAAIRTQHPNAHITCLTTKAYAELLAQSPYFNEIWVDSKPKLFESAARNRLKSMLRSVQGIQRESPKPWGCLRNGMCAPISAVR